MTRYDITKNRSQASPFQGATFHAIGELKNNKSRSHLFTGFLFGMILFFLFFMLLFSVVTYQAVNTIRTDNDQSRLALSLISNSIRTNDTTNAVGVGTGPEGSALVLTQHDENFSYETRLYLYEGFIVEEYALAESPYTPERAREVVQSDVFSFSYDDGLLTIMTDQGTTRVALRSVERGT